MPMRNQATRRLRGRTHGWAPGRLTAPPVPRSGKKRRQALLQALCFALLLGGPGVAWSADGEIPQVHVGYPKWGDSPRLIEYSWAELPFEIDNPTSEPQTFQLIFRPKGEEGAAFTKHLSIGPNAAYNDSMLVTGGRTKSYEAVLEYPDGRFIVRQEVVSEFQNAFQQPGLFFINDNPDIAGISDIAKNDDLTANVVLTRTRSAKAPSHWAGFGGASVVVVVDVDWGQMTALQFQAITDFVRAGGTLLFVSPGTTLTAAQSPLQPLLPVLPLRTRLVDRLPATERWCRRLPAASPPETLQLEWPNGIVLLESTPLAGTTVPVRESVFPAVAWHRRGLGRVGVVAFDPFDESFRKDAVCTTALWDHVLTTAPPHPLTTNALYAESLGSAASRLIGFRVPQASFIQQLLTGYFVLLCCLFLLGSLLRRHVLAWLACAACGLVLTGLVFCAAFRQMANQPAKNLISLALLCQDEGLEVTEKIANIFNKVDDRPVVEAQDKDVHFRSPAPAPSPVRVPKGRGTLLGMERRNGISRIAKLTAHARKNATFSLVSRREDFDRPDTGDMTLAFGVDGMQLGGVTPADLAPGTRGYLVLADGARRLNRQGKKLVVEPPGAAAVEFDRVAGDFEQFLADTTLPAPALLLIRQANGDSPEYRLKPPGYHETRYQLTLQPLDQVTEGGQAAKLPAEMFRIVPASKGARALYWNNEWQDAFLYGGTSTFFFAAVVPTEFRQMPLTDITLKLGLFNPSGKVRLAVGLARDPVPATFQESRPDVTILPPTEAKGTRFYFANLDQQRVIDPVTGWIVLKISISTAPDSQDPGSQDPPASKWRITAFDLEASALPSEDGQPKRF